MVERSNYDPTDEFVEGLEWQLRHELRRRGRFEQRRRRPGSRWAAFRAAAIVVLSLVAGYATATAGQELESRAERRYLVAAAEGQVELAELRFRFMAERLDDVAQRVARGELDQRELYQARYESEQVAFDLERARLEFEEIRLSGASPRHDITAPSVAGRDFVTERLGLELRTLDLRVDAIRTVTQGSAGSGPDEARWAQRELDEIEARRRQLLEEVDSRRRFLAGEVSGERLLADQQLAAAREQLRHAEIQLAEAALQLDASRAQHAEGEADLAEVRWAEYTLATAEINARLARMQLQMARDKPGR